MGQKNIRSQDSLIIDRMLLESFKDTDLSFPFQEITKMKLRFKDAEKYFGIKFDYLVFYNNYIFHEGISILYDNYIKKIEQFSKNKENNKRKKNEKIFYLFVDFDDESENLINGYDIEFEPLFTIIFEKLEIRNVTCFSLMKLFIFIKQIEISIVYISYYLMQILLLKMKIMFFTLEIKQI